MKLIAVTILGRDFRSLTANRRYQFNQSAPTARLSTKCFAGLNGSGKSNMLEVLAEIFYYLEYCHLEQAEASQKKGGSFGFEIEYARPMGRFERNSVTGGPQDEEWVHVKIRKPIDEALEYQARPWSDGYTFRRVEQNTHFLLPQNVVAYTSGQNELLSNPFYKLKYHYFREQEQADEDRPVNDRMFYIDAVQNQHVFIANGLLGEEQKLQRIHQVLSIEGLHAFRITINQEQPNGRRVPFSESQLHLIEKLKACSTCWDECQVYGKKNKKQWVLDFLVDDALRAAFGFHFDHSAFNLFKALYQLEALNLHAHSKKVRDLIRHAPKWLNISDEIPEVDPNEQIFRLEKIEINKVLADESGATVPIHYKNLSDGEHQFNEVIGTMMLLEQPGSLLLLDEPDTHFNPMWRAMLVQLLNEVGATGRNAKKAITSVVDQEVIITTHSPFAISDSYKEDVYVFERKDEGIDLSNPKIKTYGASVGMILENIFKRDKSISDLAYSDLEKIKQIRYSPKAWERAKEMLFDFGESIEKFDAISYLFAKEEEMEEKARKRKKKK